MLQYFNAIASVVVKYCANELGWSSKSKMSQALSRGVEVDGPLQKGRDRAARVLDSAGNVEQRNRGLPCISMGQDRSLSEDKQGRSCFADLEASCVIRCR